MAICKTEEVYYITCCSVCHKGCSVCPRVVSWSFVNQRLDHSLFNGSMQNVTRIILWSGPSCMLTILRSPFFAYWKHSKSGWCYLCTVCSSTGFAYWQLGMWDSATPTETTLAVPSTLPQCIHSTYY